MARRFSLWDLVFVALLVVSIPAAVFHFIEGRYGNGIIAALASLIGLVALGLGLLREGEPTPQSEPVWMWRDRTRLPHPEAARESSGRVHDWLSLSVISGFVATALMSVFLLAGYGVAAAIGSSAPGADIFRSWCAALVHNTVTEMTSSNLAAAAVLHFAAGIGWAIVYAGLVEPRLKGPGWLRGLEFAVIPWIVSLVIFLPVVGGGFLGMRLGAGPLPIIGNLILHVVYGLTLGQVLVSEGILTEEGRATDDDEPEALLRIQRGMAIAILPGMVIGGLIGLVGSSVFAPGFSPASVGVVGAIVGCVVGILIGSFAGSTSRSVGS